MTIQNIYAGFDTLEISFQGALSFEVIDQLEQVKEEATARQENQLAEIGPGRIQGHVGKSGMSGGYAYTFSTGPLGELWSFKKNSNPSEWNIGVKVYAAALVAYPYWEIKERLLQRLKDMGCIIGQESIRRVDFAMDFLIPGVFEINEHQFVAHHRSKISPYLKFEDVDQDTGNNDGTYVFRGGRKESVTIGKMPGRQVIVYDKRKAALDLGTPHWFKVWGIDPKDKTKNVWRVELRAAKKELKDKWNIRSFKDLEDSVGDVFTHIAHKIRYNDDFQTDANVSRQRQHPLWDAVHKCLENKLTEYRSGLLPNQVKEVLASQQKEIYVTQLMGLVAGLATIESFDRERILNVLPSQMADIIGNQIRAPETTFFESVERAKKRLVFVSCK
ncbi:MAG: hypothetical protein ABJN40_10755 [Sneathiella sp.]